MDLYNFLAVNSISLTVFSLTKGFCFKPFAGSSTPEPLLSYQKTLPESFPLLVPSLSVVTGTFEQMFKESERIFGSNQLLIFQSFKIHVLK